MESGDYLKSLALEKIVFGEKLIEIIDQLLSIDGIQKLKRKINQELKFIKKVLKSNGLKKEHLQCSNLTHFSALIKVLTTLPDCESVNKVFLLDDRKIYVDIVCNKGLTWIKVIARNPRSVSQICMGDASYGVRSIFDQAEEYVQCAQLYPCLFQTPKVIFTFSNGVGRNLASKLESYGISVEGNRINEYDIDESSDEESVEVDNKNANIIQNVELNCDIQDNLSSENTSHITKVNLDVSAMLAYCSSVTNGSAYLYDFDVPVLKQQAEWERFNPQKPILDNFFKGKKLYCCETAKKSFLDIVHIVGGPKEKCWSEELLERITVLPDDATSLDTAEYNENSEIFNNVQCKNIDILPVGGKIKKRSLTIFSFGDRIKAVTVTSNDGFVRAAKQLGINFVVFVHESRALTEMKEKTNARPIKKSD